MKKIISWKLIRKILKKRGHKDTEIDMMIEMEKCRINLEEIEK